MDQLGTEKGMFFVFGSWPPTAEKMSREEVLLIIDRDASSQTA